MLVIGGQDAGLVPASTARTEARRIATETGQRVDLRDPVTDAIICTVGSVQLVRRPRGAKPAGSLPIVSKR